MSQDKTSLFTPELIEKLKKRETEINARVSSAQGDLELLRTVKLALEQISLTKCVNVDCSQHSCMNLAQILAQQALELLDAAIQRKERGESGR